MKVAILCQENLLVDRFLKNAVQKIYLQTTSERLSYCQTLLGTQNMKLMRVGH